MERQNKLKQLGINQILADITGALVGHFKMKLVLDTVVDKSMQILHAEVCSIFLEDKINNPGILEMKAGSGFAKGLVDNATYEIGEGFTGTVAKYGLKFNIKSREELESLVVHGTKVWKGKNDRLQWPSGQSEFRNCIALPLKIKDQIIGVIKVENKDLTFGKYFSEEDEKYFETMANVVALAIENTRLHEQIEKQLKAIAAKAAHRIHNQVANYDGIEREILKQVNSIGIDKDKLKGIALRVAATTRDIKRMVDEFKEYGRPLIIVKDKCDVNEIIENEIWLAEPTAEIRIEQNLSSNIPKINLDAGRFAEAIKELLRNSKKAIKSRTGHGIISVSSYLTSSKKNNKENEFDFLAIDIKDNGPGFPTNFPIFNPFHSTDPQSTGLGLATVKELIEAHGGTIESLTPSEGGAHLRIYIPVQS